ncbi:MAG TPA: prepilin-type N-terminal cleavage/methylation domain-containing protein [bacterium]|nr:prepilin-type N-terminal cleavage/methylation domain-containing protein [Candidatus Omnitrophota bacterium]HOJ59711.1 prepilin-type N-terminal cleavage/methylation domain-containing protein [bacterium]HOL94268.1 prepilin-type N-terminal cleavage/methylation domain-containing protein [bacterium]HPP00787.1 prepilin-type N-terminal cleavage/methylation domain-containing protein [bacterium]
MPTARVKSFTLIELLIVVAIIGILAAIAVPNFLNAQVRAKISRSMSDQRTMELAILQYTLDANDNPPHSHEVNQNYWLTTPVAYLTSFLFDPFQQIPDAKSLFTVDGRLNLTKQQHHWDPYDKRYWPALAPEYFDPKINPDFGFRRQSIGVIIGLGPTSTYKGASTTDWHPYETSNGLYSIGIIRRYVPGRPKVDFAMP